MRKISAEEFVKAWQMSSSLGEFCNTTGLARSAASGRATFYRKHGVNLKMFPAVKIGLDFQTLKELADSLTPSADARRG